MHSTLVYKCALMYTYVCVRMVKMWRRVCAEEKSNMEYELIHPHVNPDLPHVM